MRITPYLWFDKEAREAATLYTETFSSTFGSGDSSANRTGIKNITTLRDTPSGSVDIANIELAGHPFTLFSAGPHFKFTPAISFLIACETAQEVDTIWEKLSPGGTALMDLGRYPFSERYGWTTDRYGMSWQVMLATNQGVRQRITPVLMFAGEQCGKAEEAIRLYTSIFQNSKVGDIVRYGKGEEPDREGTSKFAQFTLDGVDFAAMDSARVHDFTFTEAISFLLSCPTQQEIDYYWDQLSAVPEAEQCGWLKDKYGVSWQVVPSILNELLSDRDSAKVSRVTKAFLQMKKFDIEALLRAWGG